LKASDRQGKLSNTPKAQDQSGPEKLEARRQKTQNRTYAAEGRCGEHVKKSSLKRRKV
jgi:hypothetical protein